MAALLADDSEELLSIKQLIKLLPAGRRKRPIAFSTIYRWIVNGVLSASGQQVRLEAVRLGGRWLVSRKAVRRFSESLNDAER